MRHVKALRMLAVLLWLCCALLGKAHDEQRFDAELAAEKPCHEALCDEGLPLPTEDLPLVRRQ